MLLPVIASWSEWAQPPAGVTVGQHERDRDPRDLEECDERGHEAFGAQPGRGRGRQHRREGHDRDRAVVRGQPRGIRHIEAPEASSHREGHQRRHHAEDYGGQSGTPHLAR